MKKTIITLLLATLFLVGCQGQLGESGPAPAGEELATAPAVQPKDGLAALAEEKLYTLNGEEGYFELPESYTVLSQDKLEEAMETNLQEIIERQKSGEPIIWEAKAITGIAEYFPNIFDQMKEEGLLEEGKVQITQPAE